MIRLFGAVLVLAVAGAAGACADPVTKAAGSLAASPLASLAVDNIAAVDGSRLSLQATRHGLSREIVSPAGAVYRTTFTLLNDRFGTVSEEDGSGGVAGLFVLGDMTIATEYADGRSETLVEGAGHAVEMVLKAADGEMVCSTWYPAGHSFSVAERKAALARYARHLGVASTARPKSSGCSAQMKKAGLAQPVDPPRAKSAAAHGDTLNAIMTRIMAYYARQQPAVPPLGDGAAAMPVNLVDRQTSDGFESFYSAFLAAHEGGYTENDGNGSPANYGINQGANPDVDVVSLSQDEAKRILYERYWLASGADQLPAGLAAIHGDTAINMGVGAANDLLAQSQGDPQAYLQLRDARYRAIAAASSDKANYLSIWLRRNDDLRNLVGKDDQPYAGGPPDRFSTLMASAPDF